MKRRPKKRPTPRKVKVGTYQLGFSWVELWIDIHLCGGEFVWLPGDERDPKTEKPHANLVVGIDRPLWSAWTILVHEATEAVLSQLGLRLRPTGHFVEAASDIYIFQFNHNQFTEVAARVGSFLCDCHHDFEKAYADANRNRRR